VAELDESSADPALVRVFREGAAQQFKSTVGGAVQRALAKSVEYLGENFTVESGRCGWSQFFEHDTVGILSSAQGLLALAHANAGSSRYIESTAECLEAAQNNDGGWQVKHSLECEPNDISITESTCYCIWALRTAGRSIDSFAVSSGASWLMETQRESGGWGASERTKEANVLSTAFAVRVLSELGNETKTAKGVQWLRSMQCVDGGWGFHSAARKPDSSPAPTAHAVISLLAAGAPPDDPAIVDACAYLRAKFNDKDDQGPWQSTIFQTLVDPGTNSRLVFQNYATPWALIALVRAGASLSDDLYVQRGVDLLLDQQGDDGAWLCNGAYPRERTVWAAHDAVYALQTAVSTGLKPSTPSEEKFKAVVMHALESWLG
jgi:prenyltransferase beta subunit